MGSCHDMIIQILSSASCELYDEFGFSNVNVQIKAIIDWPKSVN